MRQRRARKGFASHVSTDGQTCSARQPTTGAPEWLVIVGGCVFIIVLFVSAVFEADIRWLHFFQAWLYIATIALTLRRNPWGYFIGISAAGFWAYTSLFVNNF